MEKSIMSIRALLAAGAVAAAAAMLPAGASAQTVAYAESGTTNVRSGPGTNYPVIAQVQGGTALNVGTCTGGWCTLVDYNGWIAQSRLNFGGGGTVVVQRPYYVQPEPYYEPYYDAPYGYYGGYYGGPSISFRFGDYDRDHRYWRHRNRDRDWDRDRHWRGRDRDRVEYRGRVRGPRSSDRECVSEDMPFC
jgi:uncharacterized protein YraI